MSEKSTDWIAGIEKVWPMALSFDAADDQLYHYTSLDSFIAIYDSDKLYGTHYLDLNDDAEFKIGFDYACRYLKRRFEHEHNWNDVEILLKKANAMMRKLGVLNCSCPWITSFTSTCNSMPHWIAYTDRHAGGLAAGLSLTGLKDKVDEFNRRHFENVGLFTGVAAFLLPCFYCEKPEKPDAQLDRLLDILFSDEMSVSAGNDCALQIYWGLMLFASFAKHRSFEWEKEWRLATFNFGGDWAPGVIKRIGGKMRVPFGVDKPIGIRELIKAVMVSPHNSKQNHRHLVSLKAGGNIQCEITRSGLPYNGR